ncbi:MAG TPA: hypothetical protein VGJ34_09035 [Gaiellaceae bacterium]|jgi:hypothetical protein
MRLAFVLLLAAVVAGCGAGEQENEPLSKEAYQQAIQEIVLGSQHAGQLFGDLVTGPRPQAECADRARAFHRELKRIVSEVGALSAPKEVADLQDEFLDAAHVSVDEIGEAVDNVEAGKLACGDQLNRAIYGLASTERAEGALNRIEAKGYIIFGE